MKNKAILMTLEALLLIGYIFILISCKSVSNVIKQTSKEKIETRYKDSVRYFDSTVIVPVERYVDVVGKYDTVVMETSQAVAKAWVDSIWLRGEIENKDIVQYRYIDRYNTIMKDTIIWKTDTIEKTKVVKVNNDKKHIWWFLGLVVVDVAIIMIWIMNRKR